MVVSWPYYWYREPSKWSDSAVWLPVGSWFKLSHIASGTLAFLRHNSRPVERWCVPWPGQTKDLASGQVLWIPIPGTISIRHLAFRVLGLGPPPLDGATFPFPPQAASNTPSSTPPPVLIDFRTEAGRLRKRSG